MCAFPFWVPSHFQGQNVCFREGTLSHFGSRHNHAHLDSSFFRIQAETSKKGHPDNRRVYSACIPFVIPSYPPKKDLTSPLFVGTFFFSRWIFRNFPFSVRYVSLVSPGVLSTPLFFITWISSPPSLSTTHQT